MVNEIQLEQTGPIEKLEWNFLSSINLIIGKNGTGKTLLLKMIYASIRSIEGYGRGNEPRSLSQILFDKIYWTFQVNKIGDLVRKGSEEPLSFNIEIDGKRCNFSFGKDTEKQINDVNGNIQRLDNSIFFPAKEVLSLFHVILKSREVDKMFGFDDTYYDLVKALQSRPSKGRNYDAFAQSRQKLEDILSGRVEFDEKSNQWFFKKGNRKFSINLTAEGIKKIAMLDTLLGNRYIGTGSVIFIDEPESALHPEAIGDFMDIIYLLSQSGIQFFIATHSYFVIKKLYLISQKSKKSLPVLSLGGEDEFFNTDLLQGMPKNPIVDESIALYKEEIELSWQ